MGKTEAQECRESWLRWRRQETHWKGHMWPPGHSVQFKKEPANWGYHGAADRCAEVPGP